MTKEVKSAEDTEMLPEYDFSKKPFRQGHHYERFQAAMNNRVLEPDLAAKFQDSKAVNDALRQYLVLTRESA
ncbi:hypothetical protein BH09SUM1_BH09SUM1_06510 [soil metagenome]